MFNPKPERYNYYDIIQHIPQDTIRQIHLISKVIILNEADERIKERVKKYLMRDDTGIRKTVLNLFLEDNTFTTETIYKYLTSKNFDVNYRGVSAMVGLMNTRLGILRIDVKSDHNIYTLKEEYRNAVKSVLDNY